LSQPHQIQQSIAMNNYHFKLQNRPHVVILGAGATMATIPKGDRSGLKASTMDNFIDNLGMRKILAGLKFKSENLEDVYSELSDHPEHDGIRKHLEDAIRVHFSHLRLPQEPTIYDLLLLSLREKDVIATFNWDPLIIHAIQRVSRITKKIPTVLFLHGNVAIHICHKDQKQVFTLQAGNCRECGQRLSPCRLLYPVQKKNYNSDPYIKNQWDRIQSYLRNAYIVTIFGYSAPSTDIEAVNLLLNAWGGGEVRTMEEIEIIDLKPEDELEKKWKPFICSSHFQVYSSFYDSILAKTPRRSVEALFARYMDCQWYEYSPILNEKMTWIQICHFLEAVLKEEAFNII